MVILELASKPVLLVQFYPNVLLTSERTSAKQKIKMNSKRDPYDDVFVGVNVVVSSERDSNNDFLCRTVSHIVGC
jgi:hypothetical protein